MKITDTHPSVRLGLSLLLIALVGLLPGCKRQQEAATGGENKETMASKEETAPRGQVAPEKTAEAALKNIAADFTKTADQNGDGEIDTWAFFHKGKKYPFRQAYDYTKDGRTDFFVTISEEDGKILSVHIDRDSWPILENVGTEAWKEEKRKAASDFWNSPAKGTEVKDRKTGKVLYVIPPHDPSKSIAICDICNAEVKRGEGYCLSTKEVLSSEDYVHMKNPLQFMLSAEQDIEAEVLRWQGIFENAAGTPWLVCDDCIKKWMKPEERKGRDQTESPSRVTFKKTQTQKNLLGEMDRYDVYTALCGLCRQRMVFYHE